MTIDVRAARAYLEAREQGQMREREALREQARQLARAAAQTVLPHFPQIVRAYLFGSVTRHGAMRRDSDIDIAIEGRLTAEAYFALWRDLERAMPGWAVEVTELGQDLHFADQVRASAEVIYERHDQNAQSEHP